MKYVVALSTGGLMESPEMYCEDFQIIEAESGEQASKIYNEKNNCDYFYGCDLCVYDESVDWLIGHSPIQQDVVDNMLGDKLLS